MPEKTSVVVTSIAAPNRQLEALANGCAARGHDFIVIGDEASPKDFQLEGCRFFSLDDQRKTDLQLAAIAPTKHYARKNLGYLIALRGGAEIIIETDDDNEPYDEFWAARTRKQSVPTLTETGWTNVYRYYSEANIWPRGFPLQYISDTPISFDTIAVEEADCAIQQGLADDNPDVDAIFRLILPGTYSFRRDRRIAFGKGAWCPFNSQNTTWWRDAFPLMYLPSYCSFRMTDIWRSFIAQRIAWQNGWTILFHEPNVWQDRNQHDLMRDFKDEVPGYLHNKTIADELDKLDLTPGTQNIGDNLKKCYEKLIEIKLIENRELNLLDAWLKDLKSLALSSAVTETPSN